MKEFYNLPKTILGFRFINNKTGLSCSSSNPARGLRVHFKWDRWNKHAGATNKPQKTVSPVMGPLKNSMNRFHAAEVLF